MEDGDRPRFISNELLPISLAVAASSAFPPLFPPVSLSRRTLDATQEQLPYASENLTDGGVFDNLGIRKMRWLRDADKLNADLVISSDAGAGFDWDVSGKFSFIVFRTIRATDILMKRVADLEETSAGSEADPDTLPVLNCSIREIISREEGGFLADAVQKKIAKIRTDLDRFNPDEITVLVQHGYSVARKNCREPFSRLFPDRDLPEPSEPWIPPGLQNRRKREPEQLAKLLGRSRARRLGIWNARDWTSWALALLCLLPVGVFAVSLLFNAAVVRDKFAPVYKVSVLADGTRNASSEMVTPFRASSGQVNVGCDSTAPASVNWQLPSSAMLTGPVTANWVNTDNLSSFTASIVGSSDSVVSASGYIRGLNSQSLPFGIRNCPGGGHGELVVSGEYRVLSVQHLPIEPYKLDGKFSAGEPLAFTLPAAQDVVLDRIQIQLSPEKNPDKRSLILMNLPEGQNSETQEPVESQDGQFVARVKGSLLIVERR